MATKPRGLLSVPGKGPRGQINLEAQLAENRPFLRMAHRLDQATGGLIIAAKDLEALRALQKAFMERRVSKMYHAVVEGVPQPARGQIELRTRLDPQNRPRQVVDPIFGKLGSTQYRVLSTSRGRAWVEFIPHTGRTHQLRIHAAHPQGLGCPILGDGLYGDPDPGGLRLHACRIAFPHPNGGWLEFRSSPDFGL
ncbi:MAG: RluA family pseudouridine synthase [Myxococcota bacterium]